MNSALSDRLQQARKRLFVGRDTELKSWGLALELPEWEIPIWHVHGVGGMGKTTLLREWRRAAKELGVKVVALDAREFEPNIEGLCVCLAETLGETTGLVVPLTATPAEICEAMGTFESRLLLQIDTFELLTSLDGWFRDSFFPSLPANVAVNLAGRNPLPMPWHGDAGWQELLRSFDLRALTSAESTDYLQRRGIDSEAQSNLLSWAHGHPLALSLAADVWLQKPERERLDLEEAEKVSFRPGDMPQLVGSLLGHLVSEVPSKAHRAALEACATVAVLSEELLADMLAPLPSVEGEESDIHALFEWLRSLSVVQANRFGLFPHDLAREVLVADLRWRGPKWQMELHRAAREHYLRIIHHSSGGEQQRAIFDCLFLHRMSPAVAPFLQWQDSRLSLDGARPADVRDCLEWVEKHEGPGSRQIAAAWFAAQSENLIIVRNQKGMAQGFVFLLALHEATPSQIEADPATQAAWNFLRSQSPLRSGDRCTHFRFWMDKDRYQDVGSTQSLIFVHAARHYITTPQLVYSFFPCALPEFWGLGFAYADLDLVADAAFTIDGRTYGTFGHDWRSRPVLAWIELLTQRELQAVSSEEPSISGHSPEESSRVLHEEAFQSAVRRALRCWSDPVSLRQSPLLETALVQRRAKRIAGSEQTPTGDEKVLALRSLLRETVAALAVAPRQDRPYRALELVFGRRTLSQESAAAVMNVSHSSFRRYLRSALDFIGESLWQRETARVEPENNLSSSFENERNLTLF